MVTTKLQSMVIGAKHSFYFQSTNQVPDLVDIPSGETTVHHDHVYLVTSRITSNTGSPVYNSGEGARLSSANSTGQRGAGV